MKIRVSVRTWILTCKTPIKDMNFMKIWNDSTFIEDILPQKSGAHFRNNIQRFGAASAASSMNNSIRTALEWSPGPRKVQISKNHEFIIDSSSFGARRQRRQPLDNGAELRSATTDGLKLFRLPESQSWKQDMWGADDPNRDCAQEYMHNVPIYKYIYIHIYIHAHIDIHICIDIYK